MSEFYKDKKKTEAKVGLTLLFAVIVIIIGYAWLTNSLKKGQMNELTVAFPDAARLEKGDGVLFRGVYCGVVDDVTLEDSRVLVKSYIDKGYNIPEGSTYLIKDKSMMGGHILEIIPSNHDRYIDYAEIQKGNVEPGIFSAVKQASLLMENLENLIWRLSKEDGMISQFEDTSEQLNEITNIANDLIKTNKEAINTAMENLNLSIAKIDFLLSKNVENIDNTLTNVPLLLNESREAIKDLNASVNSLNEISELLKKEEGSAGKLLNDDELYNSMVKTISHADSLLHEIKKHPRKYLKISVF